MRGTMSPEELQEFRESLGLSLAQFTRAIGMAGKDADRTARRWETRLATGEPERHPPPWLDTIRDAVEGVPGYRSWLIARARKHS